MRNNLKRNYNFELRLANKKEIASIAEYLAMNNLKNKENGVLKSKNNDEEATVFMETNKELITKLIQGIVTVQDFKKFDVSIYTYNYIEEYTANTICSANFRILRTKDGMELLAHEDIMFKLDALNKNGFLEKRRKANKVHRPSTFSLQKTIEVNTYFENNPRINVDDVFRKFKISKTTYYRVNKWISIRDNLPKFKNKSK
ncbi:hypothetical protein [Aquimarina aggregata]|uniref:hypothetical protein n=1 Tax=Aquimarina aggregata TaxID=1642818 RepID=UPI0024915938|nr:hypothetical protein [Aquimarina aggregata]